MEELEIENRRKPSKERLVDAARFFKTFVLLSEHPSLAAAGRALGLSPSAVGKLIARNEERIGVALVVRDKHSFSFTPAGICLLETSRRILAEIENAEHELARTQQRL